MRLFLKNHEYKYAAEQIMLMMFPAERPEYPEKDDGGDNSAVISVTVGKVYATAHTKIRRGGKTVSAMAKVKGEKLDGKILTDRLLQRIIKISFYKAAIKITGESPAWGALTGIRPGKIATAYIEEGLSDKQAQKLMQKEYFVSKERSELCTDTAHAALKIKNGLREKDIAIYIGIPFCPTRCAYCSFVSLGVEKSLKMIEPYLEALFCEIEHTAKVVNELGLRVISVYVGGGTPTTLEPHQLKALCDKLYESFDLSAVSEFTVEGGRPDTITAEKLNTLRECGVTRISINPQTMDDNVLKVIGRRHTAEETEKAYALARECESGIINMDLIAGLPEDTAEGFCKTLDKVLSLGPENVTVHTLSLKKGSFITRDGIKIPEGSEVFKMLDYAAKRLREEDYVPYYLYRQKFISGGFENVGWSKRATESVYNICIMEELCSIISMGAGGSTKLAAPKKGRIERIFNPKYPKEYIEGMEKIIKGKEDIKEFYIKEVF